MGRKRSRELNAVEKLYDLPTDNPCVLYVRVSTDDQKDGFSIPAQIELLMKYAQRNSFKIVRVFEESMSAKDSGRVQFNRMLKYLNAHPEVNKILVEKTDRLYRNFKDYATLDDNKYEIHLVKENEVLCKDSTSHQKLVHGLKVLLAKNFVDNLREETQKGRRKKAEEGYIIGKAPYGYKKINKNEGVPVPEEARFIKKAYELYASGMSLSNVRQWLSDNGYTYRPHQQAISRGHLHRILCNALYCGMIPYDEDTIFQGRHEPIVPKELFDIVQERLIREKEYEHEYLFCGVMRCARCGCAITMELRKEKYIYYHCTGSHGRCKQKSIMVPEFTLVNQFYKALKRIRVSEAMKKKFIKAAKEELHKVKFIKAEEKETLVTEQLTIRNNLDKMYDDRLSGVISEDFYLRKRAQFEQRLEEIELELDSTNTIESNTGEEILPYLEMIDKIPYYFKVGGHNVQKELARICFERVTLKGRILKFKYALPFRYFIEEHDLELPFE